MIEQLQNRLLRGLVYGDSAALLLGGDNAVARLATSSGVPLVAISDPERLPEVLAQHRQGLMHLILVGGGESDRARLKARWPRWQMSRQFGFHHLDVNGFYQHVKGPRLASLQNAAQRARSLEPLTPEEVTPLLAASRSIAEAEKQFVDDKSVPWVNISIGIACVILFALQELWGGSHSLAGLISMGAGRGHAALSAPWTVLSSAFLHIGFEHLALNMLALFSFGPLLERALGARRYLLLYVGSALGGGVLSAVGHTAIVSAGASGALWGVMVGGAVVVTWPNGLLPPLLAARARKKVWQPVLINGIYSLQPGIDWLAHLGGGIVGGALIATGILMIGVRQKDAGRWLRVSSAAAVLVCVASVGVALATGHPWKLGAPPALERQWIGFAGVSLEVPKGFAVEREPESVVYGSLDRDPAVVEVRFGAEAIKPEDLKRDQEQLRDTLTKHVIEGGTIVGAIKEIDVGALHPWLLDVKLANDITVRTWAWVVPEGVIVMRVYLMPHAPPAWTALRDSVIRSVRTTGGQID